MWGKKVKSGWRMLHADVSELVDLISNITNMRFTAVEDLKPFGLEMLSYFESPPCDLTVGFRDVLAVLRAALPVWNAKVSHG